MSLRDVLIDELRDLYSAENQLVKHMPKVARACESVELKQILTQHIEETKGHVDRLRQVFELVGKKPTGKHCKGMEGAIEEVKEALEEDEEGALYDAGIVGAVARVEHYEIAGYSAAILIATALGETEITGLLKQTLTEEQNAGKQVMTAAKGILKQAAAKGGEDESGKKPKTAEEKKSAKRSEQDENAAAAALGTGKKAAGRRK